MPDPMADDKKVTHAVQNENLSYLFASSYEDDMLPLSIFYNAEALSYRHTCFLILCLICVVELLFSSSAWG
jgi:hypothetical protein